MALWFTALVFLTSDNSSEVQKQFILHASHRMTALCFTGKTDKIKQHMLMCLCPVPILMLLHLLCKIHFYLTNFDSQQTLQRSQVVTSRKKKLALLKRACQISPNPSPTS